MSRYRASLIHLSISAVLVGAVFAVVFWVWYPKPAFQVAGALSIITLLVGVDLVLGPLLTLVVYKHGKPGLKFDLSVIVLIQLVALVYGAYTLYDEKPYYLVFSVDRLEFIPKKQVDQSEIRYDELRSKPFAELIRVFARSPEDPDEFQRFLDSVLSEGKPDLERRAEYWEPWASGTDVIRSQMKGVEDLEVESSHEQAILQRAIDKYVGAHPNLGILPVGGIEADIGIILDRDTLETLNVVNVNPW